MSEQTTPQEYFKDFPEAPFSDTFKWVDVDGYEHMVTVRSWSAHSGMGALEAAKKEIAEVGGMSPSKKQIEIHASDVIPGTPEPNSGEVKYHPVDEGGNDLPEVKTAIAGRLSVEMKDNKYYYKIMDAVFGHGEKGTKYGIAVYPEVLAAANLDVTPGNPVPVITNWRVDYICNDKGYPWKVTRLLAPK
jgi:hypothetical protein